MVSSPVDEVVTVVDDADHVIGPESRGEVYRRRLRHRVALVLCWDQRGRLFVHQRTATKLVWPAHHDVFVGGVVAFGEDYAQAAEREAGEELGAQVATPTFLFHHRFDGEYPEWQGVFETVVSGPVRPQVEEVGWHAFLPLDEVVDRMAGWTVVPDRIDPFRRYLAERSG
ncbi:NUDIX domain-containing protein [Goodfellowiella coeruleoviolacea]|uniref:Isopentenyldiphosphate isomerase n=1 Tax=Goodfellowiella coeruleoviolacea TaxID=334858 RepID=A0AAE3KJ56_9PSEU|nr:NUDIX domain-containing protein [Goodfellowiella coeruleoviolacea]MCP2163973.1 Isopentenyldiphosphate isomerase [Goodfellowiella coeruleoviolacea]